MCVYVLYRDIIHNILLSFIEHLIHAKHCSETIHVFINLFSSYKLEVDIYPYFTVGSLWCLTNNYPSFNASKR